MLKEEFFKLRVKRKDGRIAWPEFDFPDSDETELESKETEALAARFRSLSDRWVSTSISYFEIFPILTNVGFVFVDQDFEKETLTFARAVCADSEESLKDDGTVVEEFTIPMREYARFASFVDRSNRNLSAARTLNRSALSSLLSDYEAFWADLLQLASEAKPGAFLQKDLSVSFDELSDFASIEELKQAKLEQSLEDLMHGKSHVELLKWVTDKFGVNLLSDQTLISEFVEVCQRRHLITHAGSRVNKRYLRICAEAGYPLDKLPALGEDVAITRKYLRRAAARVFQVGFFSLHLMWQKLLSDWDGSDSAVLSASHDFLASDLTKMARRVAGFSINRKKNRAINTSHAYLIINEAQSYLFDETFSEEAAAKEIKRVLAQRDWSMKSPMVELVFACLARDYAGIGDKVFAAATVGDSRLEYSDVFTFNIFKEALKQDEFMQGVDRAFGTVEIGQNSGSKSPALLSGGN